MASRTEDRTADPGDVSSRRSVILCEKSLFEFGFQVVEGGQGRLRQSEVQGE